MHPVFNWLAEDLGLTAQQLEATFLFAGWQIHEHHEKGELAAAALYLGCEVHFVCAPSWRRRLIRRDNTRAFLAPLLAKRGYLTTRIQVSDRERRLFVTRVGFKLTWSDGRFDHFMLTKAPFSRTTK